MIFGKIMQMIYVNIISISSVDEIDEFLLYIYIIRPIFMYIPIMISIHFVTTCTM